MPTAIQEFTAANAAHLRVDREAGVVRGVKLLGLTSTNGRRYLESALREAAPMYEGAKVNVNHATDGGGPFAPRQYQDRLGIIRQVSFRAGEGLFGDLHYNPKHALAEQLVWDAEHTPQNVGLSHSVLAHTATRGEETIVERIEKVQSVDLVADPATTRGLFECGVRSAECGIGEPQAEALSTPQSELPGTLGVPHSDEIRARFRRICELLAEHELPLPGLQHDAARCITSDAFLDTLWQAADETEMRQHIEERASLVDAVRTWDRLPACRPDAIAEAAPPTSRDQFAAALGVPTLTAPSSAQAFVEAITR